MTQRRDIALWKEVLAPYTDGAENMRVDTHGIVRWMVRTPTRRCHLHWSDVYPGIISNRSEGSVIYLGLDPRVVYDARILARKVEEL